MNAPQRTLSSALQMFRSGMDTYDIARELGVEEAVASRAVYRQRSAELDVICKWELTTGKRL